MKTEIIKQRYCIIIREICPKLTNDEQFAIFQACKPYDMYTDTVGAANELADTFLNEYEANESIQESLKKAGISSTAFYSKILDWSLAERVAIIEMSEQFWEITTRKVN